MTMSVEYSEVEWVALKRLCVEPGEYGLNITPDNYVSEGIRLIRTSDIVGLKTLAHEASGVFIDEAHCSGMKLNPGDLLFSRSGTTGRCLLYDGEPETCTFAGFLIRFKLKSICDPRFVAYCSLSKFVEDSIAANAVRSTISNFNASKYGDLRLPMHSYGHQRAIADYLDAETGRIDALVKKKRHLVELLGERRQAIITEAATKGLDRGATMKDTGIDWLGEIPAHWQVKRLKHVAMIRVSNVDKHVIEGQPSVRLVNYTDVYYNDSITSDMALMISTTNLNKLRKFRVLSGDTVITKDSETPDDIGVPSYVVNSEPDMVCGYHLAILRPRTTEAHPKFIFYSTASTSSAAYWSSMASGLTRYGLKVEAIGSCALAVPPITEQRVIADYLDNETSRIDILVEKLERQIGLLVERRQSVITAAVTGKLGLTSPCRREDRS